ncbi:hypothetical protein PU345_002156 [Enterobacter kobei]|nr:hypothetical protein [Enterobacter kobei]
MKINNNLNLVVTHENDDGDKVYVHARPLSREIFRENFVILSKVYSALFSQGLGIIAGPRAAYMMLEMTARDAGVWEGKSGVENTLVKHIINGCTAILPVEGKGWKSIPLEVAIEQGTVDPDEVLGEIVFFTCICGINKREQVPDLMSAVSGIWGSQVTSSDATAFANSLKTSPPEETTEEKPEPPPRNGKTVSSIPS